MKEIRKTIQFTVASRIIKFLETNLKNKIKSFHNEKYSTLKKEIKGGIRQWK